MKASVYFKPCGASGLYVTHHEYGVEVGTGIIEVNAINLAVCEECGGCSFGDYDYVNEIGEWLTAKDFNEAAEMVCNIEQEERRTDFDLPSCKELDREAMMEMLDASPFLPEEDW